MSKWSQVSLSIKKILHAVALAAVGLLVLCYLGLQLHTVQYSIRRSVQSYLAGVLNTGVSIADVEVPSLNMLALNGVLVRDQQGDTLLFVQRAMAAFEVVPLLYGEVRLNTIQLVGFDLRARQSAETDSLNFQFVVDALSRDQHHHSNSLFNHLNLNSVWLRGGRCSFHRGAESYEKEVFDPEHWIVDDLSANLKLKMENDYLRVQLKRLRIREQCGLQVRNAKCTFEARPSHYRFANLLVEVNESSVQADEVTMARDMMQRLRNSEKELFLMAAQNLQLSFVPADVNMIMQRKINVHDPIRLSTNVTGSNRQFEAPNLQVDFMNHFALSGSVDVQRVNEPVDSMVVDARVKRCSVEPQALKTVFRGMYNWDSAELHRLFDELGRVQFDGVCQGQVAHLEAFGQLRSEVGNLSGQVAMNTNREEHSLDCEARLETDSVHVGRLFGSPEAADGLYALLSFTGTKRPESDFKGTLNGHIEQVNVLDYTYHNVMFDSHFQGQRVKGQLTSNDPNCKGSGYINALWNNHRQQAEFDGQIEVLNPQQLNWVKHEGIDSLQIAGLVSGHLDIENRIIFGDLLVDSLSLQNAGKVMQLPATTLLSTHQDSLYRIDLASPLAHLAYVGHQPFSYLLRSLAQLHGQESIAMLAQGTHRCSLEGKVLQDSCLADLLALPWVVYQDVDVRAGLLPDSMFCEVSIPRLALGDTEVKQAVLSAQSLPDQDHPEVQAQFVGQVLNGSRVLDAEVSAQTHRHDLRGSALTRLKFGKNHMRCNVDVTSAGDSLDVRIHPRFLAINDSIWECSTMRVFEPEPEMVSLDHCELRHRDQMLEVQGEVLKNNDFDFRFGLQKLDLDYLFSLLDKSYLEFGGLATGEVTLSRKNEVTALQTTELSAENFAYHGYEVGDAMADLDWNMATDLMLIDAHIFTAPNYQSAAKAFIQMGYNDSLSLVFDVDHLPVGFVNYYLKGVLDDLSGSASGHAELFGRNGDYTIVGTPMVHNGSFGVGLLGTRYSFEGPVTMTPDAIGLQGATLHDSHGYACTASGLLSHHYFSDFRYRFDVEIPQSRSKGLLVFDHPFKPDNLPFWGQLFMDGRCHLEGGNGYHNFQINARTATNSVFYLSPNENTYSDNTYNFLRFRSKREVLGQQDWSGQASFKNEGNEDESVYNLDLIVEATPDCQISILMDPLAEDKLVCNGDGDISINYNTKTNLNMIGQYNLNQGKYSITMRGDLLSKDFKIDNGSTVSFAGDPMNANLNITATYAIPSVNLTDLDKSFATATNMSRSTAPVDCKLRIAGDISSPQITFDLDVKRVNSDVEAMVKNTIGTQEMMNRQVFYLLLFNKFYTMDMTSGDQGSNASDLTSFASASLTSQLNNLLGQVSEYVSIGTNIRTDKGDFSDMEMDLALSSSFLNNRLLFNGSVGYRDPANNLNMSRSNSNSFIGDFDLEYLINRKGSLRFKAYSHYNDKDYAINNALTTQGIGFVVRKDFQRINDLLWWRKKEK